jgi:hypothetical protein
MTMSKETAGWWSDGALDAWRHKGDPLADAAVEALAQIAENPGMESSLGCMERLAQSTAVPRAERDPLRAFLEETARVPDWVDWAAVARGQTFFVRFGIVQSTALMLGGLLESYSDTEIARVLMRTGRLNKDTYRRVFETGSMVYDAMIRDGLRAGRRGFRTVLKVRLMHAGVRRLLARSKTWDTQTHGVAIGQEDMAFTLLMFDVATLRGAQRLGLRVSAQQREDHHHLWRVVGYLLGVDEALLPPTAGEAEALHHAITQRQRHDSSDGRALARGMVDALAGRPPFFLPPEALEALCARLLGRDLAKHLGLKDRLHWHLVFQAMVPVLRSVQRASERSESVAASLERMAVQWGEWALSEGLGDEPARFPIPGVMR